ncbi:MAG: BrnT family toxin [Moraxella sp.]|nr:BrnT family toxin [Moraxella sp.]
MPTLRLFGLLFEWHDPKFELVNKERGITLDEAASVFFDDNTLEKDDFGSYDEQRTSTIGISNQSRLLVVVWTERADIIRIITAFFPTKNQEKEYINARR